MRMPGVSVAVYCGADMSEVSKREAESCRRRQPSADSTIRGEETGRHGVVPTLGFRTTITRFSLH